MNCNLLYLVRKKENIIIFHALIIEWIERDLVTDVGASITMHPSKTPNDCLNSCDKTEGCNSFTWSEQLGCYLKEKCLTGDEPSSKENNNGLKSYYKSCKDSDDSGMTLKIFVL